MERLPEGLEEASEVFYRMDIYGGEVDRLIEELSHLPGIGIRTAQRLAFHIINMPDSEVTGLASAITNAKKNIRYCKTCFTITDADECPICRSNSRDHKTIMIVESSRDLAAIERVGKYNGVYHVLQGLVNPSAGIGPADIRIKELLIRLRGDVEELIVATNTSIEGEATAMYITKMVKNTGIKCTRIASGLPVGGDLDTTDEVTLFRALEGRQEL